MQGGRTRWPAVVATALVLVAVLAAGAEAVHHHVEMEPGHGSPVFAVAPSAAYGARMERAGRHARVCHSADGLGGGVAPGAPRPWLDLDPTGGVALWLPGMNARPCRAVLTTLSRRRAWAFAAAVEADRRAPSGVTSCPAAFGSSVTVFLTYRGRREAEVVEESLSGCTGLGAPGRAVLEATGMNDLGPIPPGIRY